MVEETKVCYCAS